MNKTVLVLGCGYIGSTLINLLLQKGYSVLGVDNNHKGSLDHLIPFVSNPNFTFEFGDITNEEDVSRVVKGVDAIVLMSAIVGFPACMRNPALSYAVNIDGTENVLEYKAEDTPLIFTSTGSVYGSLGGNCDEFSECDPPSIYGKHKLEAEKSVLCCTNHGIIHRYSTAFGVGYSSTRTNLLTNTLVYEAIVNKNLTIFEAHYKRSFVHVKDICSAILFTIENFDRLKHRLYNISNPSLNLSKRELALKIQEKTGCYLTFVDNIKDIDKRNSFVNADRILAEGWKPSISLDQGLDELVKVVPLLTGWNRYN